MTESRFRLPARRRSLVLPADAAGRTFRVAFFDADRTLRNSKSGRPSPHGSSDLVIVKNSFARLKELTEAGYLLAIVSNQAGIDLGYITHAEVEEAFQAMLRVFAEKGILFSYYDYAELYDEDRKPEPGMAWRLERQLQLAGCKINWAESFMVGDAAWKRGSDIKPDGTPGEDHSNSDRRFAENIALKHPGFSFFHPDDYFRRRAAADHTRSGGPAHE